MDIESHNDLAEMLAHYRAEIRYADQHIGRIIEHLQTNGLYDESLIVITADHGEEFGEHGLYREHWSTHDGTQRVPLLIKPPSSAQVEKGGREQLVTNVDLAPTLAEYAKIESPELCQGRSLVPVLQNSTSEWRSQIIFDHGLYTAQRAIRTHQWKLIKTYHPGMWDKHVAEYQLYNMKNDPWEQKECSSEHPDIVADLDHRRLAWADNHLGRREDPLHAITRDGSAGSNVYKRDE